MEVADLEKSLLYDTEQFVMLKPTVEKFNGNFRTMLTHLFHVHTEACGCHIGSEHEITNKVWYQKKVPFMELQKQSGLDFDEYLNRVLRLLVTNKMTEVEPLPESEFWRYLQNTLPEDKPECVRGNIEEDLADIHMFIAKDIGAEINQVFPENCVETLIMTHESDAYDDELTILKRREKHLAPIDCTGVSPAFNYKWHCKLCEKLHAGKDDCYYYRPMQYPKYRLKNDPSNPGELPIELAWKDGLVYTGTTGLKYSTRLGPLKGKLCTESEIDFDEDKSNVWLLHCERKQLFQFVPDFSLAVKYSRRRDGSRKCILTSGNVSNWLACIAPADSSANANVLVISSDDQIYFVTCTDIPPNTILRYFAKEDPCVEFWTTWAQRWCNQTRCHRCSIHGQFETVAEYRVHIALWHDMGFQGNPQNRIYYCPDCSSKFIGARDLVHHGKEVHNTLPFLCKHCTKRFESYNSLIKHKHRIHVLGKPLKKECNLCGKVYLDPKALRLHIKQIHEKSEQLHCSYCEVIFSSKYALNRHVREVHQQQQQHSCNRCGKQFTQQSNLKQHMLIHIGAKPFPCQHTACTSAFTTKQCLQVHYRKIHHYTDATMPQIHREKSLESYCLENMGYGSDTDSSGSGSSLPTPANMMPVPPVGHSSGYEIDPGIPTTEVAPFHHNFQRPLPGIATFESPFKFK